MSLGMPMDSLVPLPSSSSIKAKKRSNTGRKSKHRNRREKQESHDDSYSAADDPGANFDPVSESFAYDPSSGARDNPRYIGDDHAKTEPRSRFEDYPPPVDQSPSPPRRRRHHVKKERPTDEHGEPHVDFSDYLNDPFDNQVKSEAEEGQNEYDEHKIQDQMSYHEQPPKKRVRASPINYKRL